MTQVPGLAVLRHGWSGRRRKVAKHRMNDEIAPGGGSPWRSLLWGTLAGALAISLGVKAIDAHGRNAGLHRRIRATEAELERIRGDEARMRAELKALSEDPLYVESVLKRPSAGPPREPVVEK